MNAPTAGKQIVDRARDRGIRAACRTWLHSSCSACTSNFSVLSEGLKISAKGPSNASPTPSLNLIGQSHPGGGSLNVAQGLGEMTPLATFSKLVSDQRRSLLGFETLVVGVRMTQ